MNSSWGCSSFKVHTHSDLYYKMNRDSILPYLEIVLKKNAFILLSTCSRNCLGALSIVRSSATLSLVHMHNLHPGANIHPGCRFAPGVYFGHVNGVL